MMSNKSMSKPSDTNEAPTPHLTEPQVKAVLEELENSEGQHRRDLMTQLAWRPAWAIRSRRGALSAFKDFLRQLKARN